MLPDLLVTPLMTVSYWSSISVIAEIKCRPWAAAGPLGRASGVARAQIFFNKCMGACRTANAAGRDWVDGRLFWSFEAQRLPPNGADLDGVVGPGPRLKAFWVVGATAPKPDSLAALRQNGAEARGQGPPRAEAARNVRAGFNCRAHNCNTCAALGPCAASAALRLCAASSGAAHRTCPPFPHHHPRRRWLRQGQRLVQQQQQRPGQQQQPGQQQRPLRRQQPEQLGRLGQWPCRSRRHRSRSPSLYPRAGEAELGVCAAALVTAHHPVHLSHSSFRHGFEGAWECGTQHKAPDVRRCQ